MGRLNDIVNIYVNSMNDAISSGILASFKGHKVKFGKPTNEVLEIPYLETYIKPTITESANNLEYDMEIEVKTRIYSACTDNYKNSSGGAFIDYENVVNVIQQIDFQSAYIKSIQVTDSLEQETWIMQEIQVLLVTVPFDEL